MFEDDEEIIKVRLLKFETLRRLDEEAKKKLKGDKEFLDRNNEILRKNKELINKLVTADSQGLPIFIKNTVIDKFCSDFLFSRSIISEKSNLDGSTKFNNKNEDDNYPNKHKSIIIQETTIKNNLTINNVKNSNDSSAKNNTVNNIIGDKIKLSSIQNKNLKLTTNKLLTDRQNEINRNESRFISSSNNSGNQISLTQPMGSNYE